MRQKHHYIPQFYLAGFSADGTEKGELWVTDQREARQWQTSPEKAAKETDFYKVELKDNGDPNSLEKGLSEIEGLLAPVLRDIINNQSLPKGYNWEYLLNLIAIMAIRVPSFRSFSKRIAESSGIEFCRQIGREMVATPEAWKKVEEELKSDGNDIPDIEYEEMKKFIESNDYTLSVDLGQNFFAWVMINQSQDMLNSLSKRHWYLSVVAQDAPDLVCSDNPVSLSRTQITPEELQLNFSTPGTMLIFPLNRRMAIIGSHEGIMLPNPAPPKIVALINSVTCRNAERFIYNSSSDFIWRNHRNEICHTSDLLTFFRNRK